MKLLPELNEYELKLLSDFERKIYERLKKAEGGQSSGEAHA
jgi:hypothetical protein